ncbi:g6678 [Coccomyxa elongata]
MATKAPTHTCFVTNLPYGVTEENLRDVFKEVGPIKSVRIVTDRETGRQKGFAFIEYYDWQTAQSATRNLDGHDINGRKVVVKFAEKDHDSLPRPNRDGAGGRGGKASSKPKAMGVEAARAASHSLAAMTNNPAPAPGGSGELISSALGTKTRAELYEIMAQMKSLVQQNPEQARQILVQNAQLTKALFQAEIMLGMVKGAPVVPVPAPSHPSPAPQPQQQPPPTAQPQPQPQHYAPQHPPPPVQHPPQPQQPQPHYAPQSLPPPVQHPPQPHLQPQPQAGPTYHQPQPLQPSALANGGYAPAYSGAPAPGPAPAPQPMDPRAPPAAQMSAPLDPRAAQHSQPMDTWNGAQGAPPGHMQQPDGQQYGMPQPQQPHYAQHPQQQQQQQQQQQMPPAQQTGPVQSNLDEDALAQQALIQQVMQLTPEQVAMLPPEQQAQVVALREALMQGRTPLI